MATRPTATGSTVTLAEGQPVAVAGVPDGLRALAAIEQVDDGDGGVRRRVDRRGRVRFDRVWVLAGGAPPGDVGAALRGAGLCERDGRFLLGRPRRGQRARDLAVAAARSGLVRLLHDLDVSAGRYRLGRLVRCEPRPEARRRIASWLDGLAAADDRAIRCLASAVPLRARPWVTDELPRLLAASGPDVATRRRLVDALVAVAAALPADGLPLSALASRTVGDTHGLDAGGTCGRLAVRLAAALCGLDPPGSAAAVREVWDGVGVVPDPVSSQAVGWRLPLNAGHPAAAVAAAFTRAGQPAVLTTGLLAAGPEPLVAPAASGRATLWVVEGVALLVDAVRADVACPVLCRGGTPSVAVRRLVAQAAAQGWTVAVSSDFEPGGLQGAVTLLAAAGSAGVPWRLTVDDYAGVPGDGAPFDAASVPDTPWDPGLGEAMRDRGVRVSEEARRDVLLADLLARPGSR